MTPMRPVVSFVVPAYNFAPYIADCVAGIFAQTHQTDFEIIVVDDCSTDGTVKALDRFQDSRLTVLRHDKNQGHVVTINEGFARARGRFIARIDGDDRYRPNFLAVLLP